MRGRLRGLELPQSLLKRPKKPLELLLSEGDRQIAIRLQGERQLDRWRRCANQHEGSLARVRVGEVDDVAISDGMSSYGLRRLESSAQSG